MNLEETFEAILRVHPLYHDLVDTDVDEANGEEPETVIFEVLEVLDSDYNEFIEEQVHIETVTLKEIYAAPIEEQQKYKVKLISYFNDENKLNELTLLSITNSI